MPIRVKYSVNRAVIRAPNWRRRIWRSSLTASMATQDIRAIASTPLSSSSTSYCCAYREALPVDQTSRPSSAIALAAATPSAERSAQRISRGALRRKSKR